ncbi:MAG: phosphoribosylanthranilate isomerase [Bacteroidia bacterium]
MLSLKICGLTSEENVTKILDLNPEFIGFICHSKSPRFIPITSPIISCISNIKQSVKTGVFVNENLNTIEKYIELMQLTAIQLYHEDISFVKGLKNRVKIIKAVSIENESDFHNLEKHEQFCDYFLFDTKGLLKGGNGTKFDWKLLECYKGNKPFLISGGINYKDALIIKTIKHNKLIGVDINSKFETEPGIKDFLKIKHFQTNLTYENNIT